MKCKLISLALLSSLCLFGCSNDKKVEQVEEPHYAEETEIKAEEISLEEFIDIADEMIKTRFGENYNVSIQSRENGGVHVSYYHTEGTAESLYVHLQLYLNGLEDVEDVIDVLDDNVQMYAAHDYVKELMEFYNIDDELYVVEDVVDTDGKVYPIGSYNNETDEFESDFEGFMLFYEMLNH